MPLLLSPLPLADLLHSSPRHMNKDCRPKLFDGWPRLWLAALILCVPLRGFGAGVTIITHGHLSSIDDWVHAMALAIPNYPSFPGTNSSRYAVFVQDAGSSYTVTPTRLSGGLPIDIDSGEILVELDWSDIANALFSDSTVNIAAAVVPRLLQTNFIAELRGRALVEFPLHLIGHSRGGSLVCEMSRLLGQQGVWVDQVTTLDPHPVNNDGFFDPLMLGVVDATAQTYDNVLFADNNYETLNTYPYGEPVPGAYVRYLTSLNGGYSSAHSDAHLWYHGTLVWTTPVSDSEASITSTERQDWWTPYEQGGTNAGFLYSRIGGSDRLSLDRPAGLGTPPIRDGYNQRWDLGAGSLPNRTALTVNNGAWPNVIKLNLTGTNRLADNEATSVRFYYQYGQVSSSNLTLDVCLDLDGNPWNTNHWLVRRISLSPTGTNFVFNPTVDFTVAPTNAPPGVYVICARLSDGPRTRYLYAPESLTILTPEGPIRLEIARDADGLIRVDVLGVPGQSFILQGSIDLQSWQPLTQHTLGTGRWSYFVNPTNIDWRFYRTMLDR